MVFTIGHSTRTVIEFIELLSGHGVKRLIDIRTVPRSRRNPQFNLDTLPGALIDAGIRYTYMAGLGGFRRARPDSRNLAWRNASFRGYADYMQTAAFAQSLDQCVQLATQESVALMCAEAVPWRCHRSLVADALVARGIPVGEITSRVRARAHSLSPWAVINGTEVTYPATAPKQPDVAD